MRLSDLHINIDTNTGFQFDGDMVIPDGDLFDPASHQRFVKFGEVGSLLCNIILQVISFSSMFSTEVACEARMTEAMFSWSCA